ncbi:uncharacterized protein LOC107024848 [Solanum pennellii]|uniref:Uncharacterized protein LOC107024848 n=1 Tax=Solanum pennellii TaxID=28526 RepID=A0ABM1H732_SOLPN|nr:uncharacterized protein LOC107024848 [Solanum pennellii]
MVNTSVLSLPFDRIFGSNARLCQLHEGYGYKEEIALRIAYKRDRISLAQWSSDTGRSGYVCAQKGGMTVLPNERNELVPMWPVTGWRVCMDYRKLNAWTKKDHFSMPFMDQILDRPAEKGWYIFLDDYSGYNQISITLEDKEKTTFTFLYRTSAFKRMLFGLCNAQSTFKDV